MGCGSSAASSVASQQQPDIESHTSRLCILSEQQKEHVLSSWLAMSFEKKQHLGQQIFLNIFSQCPPIKALFHFDHIPDDLALLEDDRFIEHAERFVQVIDTAVHGLHGDIDAIMGPLLRNLGRRHIRRAPFSPDILDTFVLAMVVSLRRELGELEDESLEAWLGLISVIISNMKDGYDLASSLTNTHGAGSTHGEPASHAREHFEYVVPGGAHIDTSSSADSTAASVSTHGKLTSSGVHSDTALPTRGHSDTVASAGMHSDTAAPAGVSSDTAATDKAHSDTTAPAGVYSDTAATDRAHSDTTAPAGVYPATAATDKVHSDTTTPADSDHDTVAPTEVLSDTMTPN